jgi:hypothetical protein
VPRNAQIRIANAGIEFFRLDVHPVFSRVGLISRGHSTNGFIHCDVKKTREIGLKPTRRESDLRVDLFLIKASACTLVCVCRIGIAV